MVPLISGAIRWVMSQWFAIREARARKLIRARSTRPGSRPGTACAPSSSSFDELDPVAVWQLATSARSITSANVTSACSRSGARMSVVHARTPALAPDLRMLELGLPEEELQERFDRVQRKLVSQWELIEGFTDEPYGIVVVPSLSGIDLPLDAAKRQAYEERYLFLLFLLRQPRARARLRHLGADPAERDRLLPRAPSGRRRQPRAPAAPPREPARQRAAPLSAKLLERPRLLDEIRSLAGDPDRAHLVPYNTTRLERDLALRLGIPMYGADPKFAALGTKSGVARLFAEAGVAPSRGPRGRALARRRRRCGGRAGRRRGPSIESVVLKHDEGVSGLGNAVLDVRGLEGRAERASRSD